MGDFKAKRDYVGTTKLVLKAFYYLLELTMISEERSEYALNTSEAADVIGLSTSFLEKARINQTRFPGPKFIKLGKRVLYLRSELDKYLANPPTA